MTRKELQQGILLLIEQEVIDSGRKEILIAGVNDLFIAFGKAWLVRNAKNIAYVAGEAVFMAPRLIKFIFKR